MRVSLTRRVRFRATHRLGLASLTDAANRARFGPTADPHAHEYTCDVTLGGVLPAEGALIDLSSLDHLLAEQIARPLGDRDLNEVDPTWREGRVLVTCETLAVWCWDQLEHRLPPGVELERVRVAEDDGLSAECRRSEVE
jgi:6-pyruvoyltetrahydropterin/6-carboxytetrahydropterin synthase